MADAVNIAEKVKEAVSPVEVIAQSMNALTQTIRGLLPSHISAERFILAAKTHLQMHEDLGRMLAPNCNRHTIYLSLQKAAGDGLMLDGREACFVCFNNNRTTPASVDVAYIPMYQGLLKLAQQAGGVKSVIAEVVYATDTFTWRAGLDPTPVHTADWFADSRGKPVGAWAALVMQDGGSYVSILPRNRIMRIAAGTRRNSKQYDPEGGTHWQEWWKKAALRNVLKKAPKGRDLAQALNNEDEAEAEMGIGASDDEGVHLPSVDGEALLQPSEDETQPQMRVINALAAPDPDDIEALKVAARTEAKLGSDALRAWWGGLGRQRQLAIKPFMEDFKAVASLADQEIAAQQAVAVEDGENHE